MNIDDRLRAAQRQQLYRVQNEVHRRGLDRPPSPAPRWPWFFTVAVAAAVVVLVFQMVPRPQSETMTTAMAPAPDTSTPGPNVVTPTTATESDTVKSEPSMPSSPALNAESTRDADTESDPESAAGGSAETTASETPESETPESETPESETTVPETPESETAESETAEPEVMDSGVANEVCDTGFRAGLERASLRYVSDEQGWNRMIDLVNEQDGPYYFGLWEPDYPGIVSVEVTLERPVRATEIQLAQHPYKDVSGTITVETEDMVIPIELSGRGGFQSHRFDEPIRLDSFVITRTEAPANITEVIICVEP